MSRPPAASEPPPGRGLVAALLHRVQGLRGSNMMAVGRNTGWVMLEKLSRAVLSALISAWVARYLGPVQFSSIAYGLAVTVFLVPFAHLGMSNLVVRDFAREPARAHEILGTTLLLRTVAGLACFSVAVAVLLLTVESAEGRLVGTLVAAQLLFQSTDAIDFWFQSRLESRIGVKSRMVATFAVAGLKVALILAGAPLWTFALCISLEMALMMGTLLIAYHRHRVSARLSFDRRTAVRLVKEGVPFLFGALAVAVTMRVDQILLAHMTSAEMLGLYAAVVPLAQAGQLVPQSLLTSLAPMIARAADEGPEAFDSALRMMFLAIGGLSLCMAMGLLVLAPFVVPLLLGPAYARAIPVLQVYGFTNITVALGSAWSVWASSAGRGKLVLFNTACGGLVSLAANLLLIPQMGILGAAIAANLAFAASGLVLNFFTCRHVFRLQIGMKPRRR